MIIDSGEVYDLGGGFRVRHLLPLKQKRLIGPFIFLDHMGPLEMTPTHDSDVRPHPHIGLSTMTYLYDGRIVHRDTLGNTQVILPGEVNWMTSGNGIVHSERFHEEDRGRKIKMEGLQFWVALPDKTEDQDPTFFHYDKSSLPEFKGEGFKVTVVAGEAFGLKSPLAVSSPMAFLSILAQKNSQISFTPKQADFEIGFYVLEGAVQLGKNLITAGQFALPDDTTPLHFQVKENSRFIIIGGEPFKTQRHIYWNFVSSSREKIEAAKKKWSEEKFPLIPGDDKERIPLGD